MVLYPGVTRALDLLARSRDHEIVCAGIECWIDDKRIHRRTVNRLIDMLAVSDSTETNASIKRFALNSVGRSIRRRPELSVEIIDAVSRGQQFTIIDDQIKKMGEPSKFRYG